MSLSTPFICLPTWGCGPSFKVKYIPRRFISKFQQLFIPALTWQCSQQFGWTSCPFLYRLGPSRMILVSPLGVLGGFSMQRFPTLDDVTSSLCLTFCPTPPTSSTRPGISYFNGPNDLRPLQVIR